MVDVAHLVWDQRVVGSNPHPRPFLAHRSVTVGNRPMSSVRIYQPPRTRRSRESPAPRSGPRVRSEHPARDRPAHGLDRVLGHAAAGAPGIRGPATRPSRTRPALACHSGSRSRKSRFRARACPTRTISSSTVRRPGPIRAVLPKVASGFRTERCFVGSLGRQCWTRMVTAPKISTDATAHGEQDSGRRRFAQVVLGHRSFSIMT